tara:strand:+ start:5233 stop:6576 length:1344 start_codon:yes stop_codon:yes gene_type:complete
MYLKKFILSSIALFLSLSFSHDKAFTEIFIDVAKHGNPCVVSIVSEKVIENDFHQFFSPFGDVYPNDQYRGQSLGSGVIIDSNNGYIITNNHVIESADEITVILENNKKLDAKVVGTDPLSDIAVIKVEYEDLHSIKLGDSDLLEVGEWVVAIGSPFGLHLNHTVTAGIISAVGRTDVISRNHFEDFIQHDAAINPGNSGGALFNLDGELIGINTAIATDGYSRSNVGVGFAIPINMVKRVMADLIKEGIVTRGWLGVQIQDINDQIAKALNLNEQNGAIISEVINGSPAEASGLKQKDVIIDVNKVKITNSSKLKNVISSGRPNEKVDLTVIRNGKQKKIMVTLGIRPNLENITFNSSPSSTYDILGMKVENNDNMLGVRVIDIKKKSPAYKNEIILDDIITEIGKTSINNVEDYRNEIDNYSLGDMIMMRIFRGESPYYVAFEIF